MNITKRWLLLLAFLFFGIVSLCAQDLLKQADLSKINIDKVSDADIATLQQQLKASGMTQQQAEQMAASKGMPATEIAKLRDRLSRTQAVVDTTGPKASGANRQAIAPEHKELPKEGPSVKQSNVFGSLLNNPSLSFEPNLKMATPLGYVLGTDDELIITVSGYQEANFRLMLQPEGTITIPQLGIVSVSGLTIEDATQRIKKKMASGTYPTLASGLSKLNISLGKIRSIHITIIGAVKSGNYTVSSLTTLFNALYNSGALTTLIVTGR